MSIVDEPQFGGSVLQSVDDPCWDVFIGKTHECRVWLCPEDDGGYSATMPLLPGVISQGDTIDETFQNIAEAFLGAVESWRERGIEIPWRRVIGEEKTDDIIERWILVDG